MNGRARQRCVFVDSSSFGLSARCGEALAAVEVIGSLESKGNPRLRWSGMIPAHRAETRHEQAQSELDLLQPHEALAPNAIRGQIHDPD